MSMRRIEDLRRLSEPQREWLQELVDAGGGPILCTNRGQTGCWCRRNGLTEFSFEVSTPPGQPREVIRISEAEQRWPAFPGRVKWSRLRRHGRLLSNEFITEKGRLALAGLWDEMEALDDTTA